MAGEVVTAQRLKRPQRVLVVEDDPGLLKALRSWLISTTGVEVVAAPSAAAAMADHAPASFDLCLLDYNLDGLDGLVLGAMIRELNPAVRLILMSGDLTPRVETLALEQGFERVLRMPMPMERLSELLD